MDTIRRTEYKPTFMGQCLNPSPLPPQICPQKAVCEENSLRLEWADSATNELRLLTLCFGLVQTVREAFPSLMHIVKEYRQRKMNIHHPPQQQPGAGSP